MALTNKLINIADAIRNKTNTTEKLTLDEMPTKIESIETKEEPNLQDKSVEITENGTINIVADDGYDGLNNVEVVTNIAGSGGGEVAPNYVSDGLIAWFDENEPMDENEQWHNKIGDDYIHIIGRRLGTNVTNPYMHFDSEQGLVNNADYSFVSSKDYYKKGYTIEIVGMLNGRNSDSEGGGWLVTGDIGTSAGIGSRKAPSNRTSIIEFINTYNDGANLTEFTINNGKFFGASIYLEDILERSNNNYYNYTVKGSVHGSEWRTIKQTSNQQHGSKAERLVLLGYYGSGSTYRACGSIRCIRIYDRQLSNEEIAANHAIDVARFNLEK